MLGGIMGMMGGGGPMGILNQVMQKRSADATAAAAGRRVRPVLPGRPE